MAFVKETSGGTFVALTNSPAPISYQKEKSSFFLAKSSSQQACPAPVDPLASALIDKQVVVSDNVEVLENVAIVSKDSFKSAYIKHVQQCTKEGLFIFVYTGPVVQVGQEYSLKFADFIDNNPETHVTPATLLEWLSAASSVHSLGCALFILDCPFSKEISSALTNLKESTVPLGVPLGTQLIAIGTVHGDETAVVLGALNFQSILCFFLGQLIRSTPFTPGILPLGSIIQKTVSCTTALSSLIISYDQYIRAFKPCTIEPTAKFLQRLEVNNLGQENETDSFSGLEFLARLFDQKKPTMNLEHKVYRWLFMISNVEEDKCPLKVLFDCGILTGRENILLTVIGLLLYSIASIQVTHGKPQSIAEPNLFIIAFIKVISMIEVVHREMRKEVDLVEACKLSWEYYHKIVTVNKLNDKHLKQLYEQIKSSSGRSPDS